MGQWNKDNSKKWIFASRHYFGSAVSLSGYRYLIGGPFSEVNGVVGGATYIFHRVNGEWKEGSKLVPADGVILYYFGNDVALYGDTAIIGSPYNDDMGTNSGSVYIFVRRDGGTWEEVQKLTPADGDPGGFFVWGVAIYGDTSVIGDR